MALTRRAAIAGLSLSGLGVTGCAVSVPVPRLLTFPAPDGVPVSSLSWGAGSRGVVLVPGGHGVGDTWDVQASRLASSGFRVLAIDYRGLGHSSGLAQDDAKIPLDILGAVRQLRSEGVAEVSVVGASWGGWAAGTAAVAEPGLIDRLVFLAHSPFETPERLVGRKLFIVARDDRDGSGRPRLERIRQQYELTPAPRDLIVLEGSAHAQLLFLSSQRERLFGEMHRFLSSA